MQRSSLGKKLGSSSKTKWSVSLQSFQSLLKEEIGYLMFFHQINPILTVSFKREVQPSKMNYIQVK